MQTLKQKYSCKHIITLDAKCKQEIVDKKLSYQMRIALHSLHHIWSNEKMILSRGGGRGGEKLKPAREKQKKELGMSESRNGTSIFCS